MTLAQSLRRAFKRIYIRAPEPIPPEHRSLLLLVGAARFISAYDVNIYGLAIPQIQKSFGIADKDIGLPIVFFRMGMIPAIALAYLADRVGRRTLMMVTLAGATFATVWTAFTQNLVEFVLAQTLARVFIYTEELLCVVVIAEEFNERTRGWAVGQLGALAALGAGFAAVVFGFVNLLPYGWRAIYFLGAVPLLWLLWARQSLPETRRFQEHNSHALRIDPLLSLLRHHPRRLILLVCVAAPYAFSMASAILFVTNTLQKVHHWAPGQVTTLILGGGAIAILGNTVAGSLSDRFGRKTVLSATILISVVAYASFYTWATGPWLVLLWTVALFTYMAADIMIAAFGAELFPTAHRSLASSIRLFVWLTAGGLGLLFEAQLFRLFNDHGTAIALMTLSAPISIFAVAMLPEPAKKSLEEISADAS
ncbi:MAG: MFS transporter [Micropepsaceae bacterium]